MTAQHETVSTAVPAPRAGTDPVAALRAQVTGDLMDIVVDLDAGDGCRLRDVRDGTEYLDAIISVRLVDGLEQAIEHINTYGSHHTESIITADAAAAERFLAEVDSAIVLHNASTQFADGGEFGMGAEIGISTGKLHARGPVGCEQLTSYKYLVRGTGQVRP